MMIFSTFAEVQSLVAALVTCYRVQVRVQRAQCQELSITVP
jgi:hypothetical protein